MKKSKKKNPEIRGFKFRFKSRSNHGDRAKTIVTYHQNMHTMESGITVQRLLLLESEHKGPAYIGPLVKRFKNLHLYQNEMHFKLESLGKIIDGVLDGMEKFKARLELDPTIFDNISSKVDQPKEKVSSNPK